ncbi:hypothetical protein B7495_10580 [Cryobacterium sp. LW097]|uniref:hypothetical protein n=1 Tax=Cryobacterium sp. LW097 TaxID=1978566 RepID=UPI000B4C898D|nr:hypothetical protein [Cryobacterium sp. LW097]ASD22479.1 hypothetical protein B7495_10580 [Cryobacterium sp. LW097]
MDVPPAPGEFDESTELERLRRRAYGRNADIAGDAAARARLTELEAAVTDPDPDSRAVTESDPAEGLIADSVPIGEAPVAPWWRRRRSWLTILGGTITTLALTAAIVAWMQPSAPDYVRTPNYAFPPDAILGLVSEGTEADEPNDPHGTLNRLGLNADAMRRYETYGYLTVWSGKSRYGSTCLLVAHPVQGLNEGIGAEACSPDGDETIADLAQTTRSLTRFVLKSDHVDVYEYVRPAEPGPPPG